MTYQKVDIKRMYDRQVYSSLCVPSFAHAYSVCFQYMREWFLSKFDKNYFKTVHEDGKHILQDARDRSFNKKLKTIKPAVAIIAQINSDFDREKIEFYPHGLNVMMTRSKFEDAFFKDKKTNSYMSVGLELDLINFTFRVKLSTRAQQIDVFKYMKLAFKVGATEGDYLDMDFHVPYDLMVQVAIDNGFDVDYERKYNEDTGQYDFTAKTIKDPVKLLNYLNSHSSLPFLYKFRCINGHNEFFVRLRDLYVHKGDIQISMDDGDRQGHINTDFHIELNVAVRFPAPMYYVYYSENKHTEFELLQPVENAVPVFTVKMMDVPEVNKQGWDQYLTTEYTEENMDEPMVIELEDLFRGDLGKVIDYNKSIYLSPEMFMEIKLYNGGKEIEYDMDWETVTLTTKECMTDIISFISVYADLEYVNNFIKGYEQMEEDRLS